MSKKPHDINYKLLISFSIILVFGLIMLTSASQVIALDNFADPYYYIKHQLLYGLIPGLIFLIVISKIKYPFLQKIALPLFFFAIILLIMVLIPQLGFSHAKARRWMDLGIISIQPSEIAKLCIVIFMSAWLVKKKNHITNFYYTFLPFCVYLGIIILLIALEPDIGTLSVILVTAISIYFVSGLKYIHFLMLLVVGLLGLGILVKAAPYRLNRITTFLNPESHKLGISYQINQSMLAIGSGGITGLGLGQSKQKYQYLPEVMGDSIFAIIAEETGFIFTTLFVVLYLYFIIICFGVAIRAPDNFSKLMVTGVTTWFGFQAFVNMGAMVNILPLTGLPLPFVSYGSSALIVSMAGMGAIINVSKYTQK